MPSSVCGTQSQSLLTTKAAPLLPAIRYPAVAEPGHKPGVCDDRAAGRPHPISLPINKVLSEDDQAHVPEKIRAFLG